MNQVPDCWVECDGRQIPTGMWAGQKTPDLNNAQRFLRGGTQTEVLETQEDALQSHSHHHTDFGHTHRHADHHHDNDLSSPTAKAGSRDIDYTGDQFDYPHTKTTQSSYSGITVTGVKSARTASETRPKNMKVTFIMKVC